MSGIFGWSLPPGCGDLPGEGGGDSCSVCMKNVADCICPECPECGEYGDPNCYEEGSSRFHGLRRNIEQIASEAAFMKKWNEDREAENEAAKIHCCDEEGW